MKAARAPRPVQTMLAMLASPPPWRPRKTRRVFSHMADPRANQEALPAGGLREGMMLEIPSHDEPDVHVQLVGAGAR